MVGVAMASPNEKIAVVILIITPILRRQPDRTWLRLLEDL